MRKRNEKNKMKMIMKSEGNCDNEKEPQLFKMSLPIFIELLLQLLVGNID